MPRFFLRTRQEAERQGDCQQIDRSLRDDPVRLLDDIDVDSPEDGILTAQVPACDREQLRVAVSG